MFVTFESSRSRRIQNPLRLDGSIYKINDNRGAGDKKNFYRALGICRSRSSRCFLYRGGANNKYLENPRSNTNPLPTVGLTNLCKEDFSCRGVYLYSENFSTAPKEFELHKHLYIKIKIFNTSNMPPMGRKRKKFLVLFTIASKERN